MHELITATLHTSGQFAVRLVLLLLTGLVLISVIFDLDMLLGAFAAGVITKLLLAGAEPKDAELIDSKLEAIGFGFLVPIFFINTGITFDLNSLVSSPTALALLPVFLILLLIVRGLPGMLSAPAGFRRRRQARDGAVQRHRAADHRRRHRDRRRLRRSAGRHRVGAGRRRHAVGAAVPAARIRPASQGTGRSRSSPPTTTTPSSKRAERADGGMPPGTVDL